MAFTGNAGHVEGLIAPGAAEAGGQLRTPVRQELVGGHLLLWQATDYHLQATMSFVPAQADTRSSGSQLERPTGIKARVAPGPTQSGTLQLSTARGSPIVKIRTSAITLPLHICWATMSLHRLPRLNHMRLSLDMTGRSCTPPSQQAPAHTCLVLAGRFTSTLRVQIRQGIT